MKKFIKIALICQVFCAVFCYGNVFADANLSVSSNSVTVGDTITVSVNMNAAAWGLHVDANNPAYSGCSISVAGVTDDLSNAQKRFSASCVASEVGTVSFILSGDTTDASGNTSIASGTVTVSINPAPTPTPTPTPEPTPAPTPVPTPTPAPAQQNNEEETLVVPKTNDDNNTDKEDSKDDQDKEAEDGSESSSNAKLSKIYVKGDNFKKNISSPESFVDIAVDKDVTKIKISADAEDKDAKIVGLGEFDLKDGENLFTITVTAKDGSEAEYTVRIYKEGLSGNEPASDGVNVFPIVLTIILILLLVAGGLIYLLIIKNPKKKEHRAKKKEFKKAVKATKKK